MYPIEVDIVRRMTIGKPVLDVTWDIVADINAKHAPAQAGVTKQTALAALRANAQEAAAALRTLTDAQLDVAAPFGLAFGAPVSTQFVIEDHPVRHAWHHLARIRAALGR
jgi:hypothetical protein